MHKQIFYLGVVVGLMALVALGQFNQVQAQEPISTSDNYQMVDSGFEGTAGSTGCSGNYCNQSGLEADGQTPILEVSVNPGLSELERLRVDQVATKAVEVTIKNYLSYGYTMQVVGPAPTYDGRAIATSKTPVSIEAGTEQFGLNLVANSSPSIGQNPLQNPADGTVFGVVESNYNQPDKYAYNDGAIVARGVSTMQEVGQTTYTISLALAISNVTPAGKYVTDLSVVVVPIY